MLGSKIARNCVIIISKCMLILTRVLKNIGEETRAPSLELVPVEMLGDIAAQAQAFDPALMNMIQQIRVEEANRIASIDEVYNILMTVPASIYTLNMFEILGSPVIYAYLSTEQLCELAENLFSLAVDNENFEKRVISNFVPAHIYYGLNKLRNGAIERLLNFLEGLGLGEILYRMLQELQNHNVKISLDCYDKIVKIILLDVKAPIIERLFALQYLGYFKDFPAQTREGATKLWEENMNKKDREDMIVLDILSFSKEKPRKDREVELLRILAQAPKEFSEVKNKNFKILQREEKLLKDIRKKCEWLEQKLDLLKKKQERLSTPDSGLLPEIAEERQEMPKLEHEKSPKDVEEKLRESLRKNEKAFLNARKTLEILEKRYKESENCAEKRTTLLELKYIRHILRLSPEEYAHSRPQIYNILAQTEWENSDLFQTVIPFAPSLDANEPKLQDDMLSIFQNIKPCYYLTSPFLIPLYLNSGITFENAIKSLFELGILKKVGGHWYFRFLMLLGTIFKEDLKQKKNAVKFLKCLKRSNAYVIMPLFNEFFAGIPLYENCVAENIEKIIDGTRKLFYILSINKALHELCNTGNRKIFGALCKHFSKYLGVLLHQYTREISAFYFFKQLFAEDVFYECITKEELLKAAYVLEKRYQRVRYNKLIGVLKSRMPSEWSIPFPEHVLELDDNFDDDEDDFDNDDFDG